MKSVIVAKRYAKALFDLALEMNVLEEIKKDMALVVDLCKTNNQFRRLLTSPVIRTDKKNKILKEIFDKKVHEISLRYILIITRKRREAYLENIALQFIEQYKKYKHIVSVNLETATEIQAKSRERIIKLLEDQTKGSIELEEMINKEIIGGFILNYENKKYDASVSSQLTAMKKAIADINLYISKF
jgi:F-type H+-transporting ATPase subunit delta